jgi:hypothetical protein
VSKFVFRATSYHPHNLEIVPKLLSCHSIHDVLGSYDLLVNGESKRINSLNEFNDPKIKNGLVHGTMATTILWCLNGIQVGFGTNSNQHMGAPNVFNFEFTDKHIRLGIVSLERLQAVFSETIPLFMPERIIVYDKPVKNVDEPKHWMTLPDGRRYSSKLNWLDYFSKDITTHLGTDRFDRLKTCEMKFKLGEGVMIVLQREPFDGNNPVHQRRRMRAEREMGLNE